MIYLTDDLSWFLSKAQGYYYLDGLYEITPDKVKKILQHEKVQIYMNSDFSYKMLQKILQCKIPTNHKKQHIKKFKAQDQLIFFHTKLIFYDDDVVTKEAIQHLFKLSIAKLTIANTFIF